MLSETDTLAANLTPMCRIRIRTTRLALPAELLPIERFKWTRAVLRLPLPLQTLPHRPVRPREYRRVRIYAAHHFMAVHPRVVAVLQGLVPRQSQPGEFARRGIADPFAARYARDAVEERGGGGGGGVTRAGDGLAIGNASLHERERDGEEEIEASCQKETAGNVRERCQMHGGRMSDVTGHDIW